MRKIVAIVIVIVLLAGNAGAETLRLQPPQTLSNRYVGLALSIFPGMGAGHALMGRYFNSKAPLFTAGEGIGCAIMMSGIFYGGVPIFDRLVAPTGYQQALSLGFLVGGAVILAGFKIWEIADFSTLTISDDLGSVSNSGLERHRAVFGAPNHDSTQALGIILHW